MPINYSYDSKREIQYQGLINIPVFVEDLSISSPDYVRITSIPNEFTSGKNFFKFRGNPERFAEGAPLYIEVLDSTGAPMYYDVSIDTSAPEGERAILVSVYVYPNTPPGEGTIIICGTITIDKYGDPIAPTDAVNFRWSSGIFMDPTKKNSTEIYFENLPSIAVTQGTQSYQQPKSKYVNNKSVNTILLRNATYTYNGQSAIIVAYDTDNVLANCYLDTGSNQPLAISFAIPSSSYNWNGDSQKWIPAPPIETISPSYTYNQLTTLNDAVFNYIYEANPTGSGLTTSYNKGILLSSYAKNPYTLSGSASAYQFTLDLPVQAAYKNTEQVIQFTKAFIPKIAVTAPLLNASATAVNTENIFSGLQVTVSNLTPLTGQVDRIKCFYKSDGLGGFGGVTETWQLINELKIPSDENYMVPDTYVFSLSLPTTSRQDNISLKFEFINPSGISSDQFVELNGFSQTNGANTYIEGGDNLLTGSLYVAGATGTGVQISGKRASAFVKSIGYQGFQSAIANTAPGGFLLYSGSAIGPEIGTVDPNEYSGVGLDLVANSDAYFRFTTANNGELDIRTKKFFIGDTNVFVRGDALVSPTELEIKNYDPTPDYTKFHLDINGAVTASAVITRSGSNDSHYQRSMDTNIGLFDGRNNYKVLGTYKSSSISLSEPGTFKTVFEDSFYVSPFEGALSFISNGYFISDSGSFGAVYLKLELLDIDTLYGVNYGQSLPYLPGGTPTGSNYRSITVSPHDNLVAQVAGWSSYFGWNDTYANNVLIGHATGLINSASAWDYDNPYEEDATPKPWMFPPLKLFVQIPSASIDTMKRFRVSAMVTGSMYKAVLMDSAVITSRNLSLESSNGRNDIRNYNDSFQGDENVLPQTPFDIYPV